jgi:hypothetical protein
MYNDLARQVGPGIVGDWVSSELATHGIDHLPVHSGSDLVYAALGGATIDISYARLKAPRSHLHRAAVEEIGRKGAVTGLRSFSSILQRGARESLELANKLKELDEGKARIPKRPT